MAISRRTYYKYRDKEDPDYYEYLLIKDVFDESKGTYGYRRVLEGLKIKYGVIFNHKKVARIMKKYNLKPEYIRRLRPNIGAKKIEENVQPNLVNRQFKTKGLNQIWCTDITYLTFGNKRAYLSTIIDLYDRHVVAYQISKFNNIPIVIDTLNKALETEKDLLFTKEKKEEHPRQIMTITQAMENTMEVGDLENSKGKISGEFAYLYPPGIPLLVPGEEITEDFLKKADSWKSRGIYLQGLTDHSQKKIKTVKENK